MLPITRWTGSKRYQAEVIVDRFPKEVNTYFESFIGSGSVLGEYLIRLDGGYYKCKSIICTDTNTDLINIWKFIKEDPDKFLDEYNKLYEQFEPLSLDDRKIFYYNIRNEYNKLKRENSKDITRTIYFNWLMRTCFNGLVRYSKNGDFNTSCHFTRHGMTPKNMEKLITEWSRLLNKFDVQFFDTSYDNIPFPYNIITKDDIVYCDLPYANFDGMYEFESFDNIKFFDWLRKLPCNYLLSYDGTSGKEDNTYNVPEDLYDEHIYVYSSQSGFKKLIKNNVVEVSDSLYIKNKV